MHKKSVEALAQAVFEGFELTENISAESEERFAITIWLPATYKKQFALIQKKTKRRFGKKMIEVFMSCIDQVSVGIDPTELEKSDDLFSPEFK